MALLVPDVDVELEAVLDEVTNDVVLSVADTEVELEELLAVLLWVEELELELKDSLNRPAE